MIFGELVQKRRSVRRYADRPVAKEDILKCLEAARLAPSGCNSQPWHFIVIDEPELGLHPAAIRIVAGLLRAAALHSQVIVATQSPTFLPVSQAMDQSRIRRTCSRQISRGKPRRKPIAKRLSTLADRPMRLAT